MYPAISHELATARVADLRRQAQRDAQAGTVTRVQQPGRNRVPIDLRRAGRTRRFGQQLRMLLRA